MVRKGLVAALTLLLLISGCPLALSSPQSRAPGPRSIDEGLVGYWSLDEGSGAVAHDTSGHGNNGNFQGNPVWTQGVCGGALHFDGYDDYVEVPNAPSLNFNNSSFSYSVWVRMDVVPQGVGEIFGKRITAGNDYEIQFDRNRQLEYIFGDPWKGYTRTFASMVFDPHVFYLITVVRTGGYGYLYVNGTLDQTLVSLQNVTSPNDLFFAKDPVGSEELNGTLDDIRLYDRALSVQEIGDLFANTACMPDISIGPDDIYISDTSPINGSTIYLSAIVHDIGTVGVSDLQVDIYDNMTLVGSRIVIAYVGPNSHNATPSIPWVAGTAGIHVVTVKVDPDNKIVESNETNNNATKFIVVAPRPLPDLVITSSDITFSNQTPQPGIEITIYANITNIGGANATNVTVRYFDTGTQFGNDSLVSLITAHGGKGQVTKKWNSTILGLHPITLSVDPEFKINESNETNNKATRNVTVVKKPLPDLSVTATDISVSSKTVLVGSSVTVGVNVTNKGDADVSGAIARYFDGMTQFGNDASIPMLKAKGGMVQITTKWTATTQGDHILTVRLDPDNRIIETKEDNNNASVTVTVVNLTHVNHPPVILSSPLEDPVLGVVYSYHLVATDPDGDTLEYTIDQPIPGMSMDRSLGLFQWTPTAAQVGAHNLTFRVNDGHGGETTQLVTLTVTMTSPTCTITFPSSGLTVRGKVTVLGTATKGQVALDRIQVRIDGGPWVDASGTGHWSYALDTRGLRNGPHKIEASAVDLQGATDNTSVQFLVDNPGAVSAKYSTRVQEAPWLVVVAIAVSTVVVITYDNLTSRKRPPNARA